MRLGKTKSSDPNPACLIHFCAASRVAAVISNCTGRWNLCCITIARVATCSPWQMSRTLRLTRSQPRSLLSMPRLKKGELANPAFHLQANLKGPRCLDLERCLLGDDLALVPRLAMNCVGYGSHDGLPSS